ncbi:MAG: SAM-dependent methyltransferase [Psychromonas sp.]
METNNKKTVTPFVRRVSKTKKSTKTSQARPSKFGLVSLVSAGPGDPELLTMKAFRVIQQTNVIIYDHLVSHDIQSLFPETSEIFYSGKKENKSMTQQQIERLIINKSKQGLNVCYLKGGDVLSRDNSELGILKQFSINVQIIPGVLSVQGNNNYQPFEFAMAL